MKHTATLLLAACLTFVGCSDTSSPTTTVLSATNKIEMNISGMDCTGCSSSICSAVEQVAGVTGAIADVKTGDVTIALEDRVDASEAKIEISKVILGLSDGKYKVNTITIEGGPNIEPTPALPATPNDTPTEESPADQEQVSSASEVQVVASYKVTGMDCSGCSSQIVAAVKAVDGVQKVEADHMTGAVRVSFDDRFDDKRKTDEIKDVISKLSNGKYSVSY